MSIFFGEHKRDSKFNMDAGIRNDVTREVRNRMKSRKGLCERLCDIIADKVTVRKINEKL